MSTKRPSVNIRISLEVWLRLHNKKGIRPRSPSALTEPVHTTDTLFDLYMSFNILLYCIQLY